MIEDFKLPPRAARMQIINNYIQKLRADTGYYWGWITNSLSADIDCEDVYEMLGYDERVADCLSHTALKSCGWEVEIKSHIPAIQHLLNKQTTNIKDFIHARKSLLEKAILYGVGILRKKYRDVQDFELGVTWSLINDLEEVSVRRLMLERAGIGKIPYWTIWHPTYDKYIILEDRAKVPNICSGAALQDYIWMMYSHEEAEAYFMGFGQILTQLIYLKNELKKNWAELAGFWSKPFILPKFNMAALNMDATMSGISTINGAINAAKDAFNSRKISDNIIMCDVKEDITIKEMGAMGNNIIEGFLEWIDKAIDRLFYSSTLTTSAGDGSSSYALGEVHANEANHNFMYNRKRLAENIKYQLYLDTIYRNQKQLMQLGVDVHRVTINDFSLKLV